jgi:hypothetical protein
VAFLFFRGKIPCEFYPYFFAPKITLAASAAEVGSANVVGYSKITLPANAMTIVGNQFQYIGGSAIELQDIKGVSLGEEGTDFIKIWDATTRTYMTAYYWGDSVDGVFDDVNNTPDNYDDDVALGAGWGDRYQTALHATIVPGQGFWMQSVAGGAVQFSGEVSTDNTITLAANQMTLVCNTLPMAIELQDIKGDGLGEEGTDFIKIWDASSRTYMTAYYWGDSVDGVFDDVNNTPDNYDDDVALGAGWGDRYQTALHADIAVGQGFWMQSVGGGKVSFPAAE